MLRASAAYQIAVSYAAVFVWSILFLGVTVYLAIDVELDQRRDREITAELDRLSREPGRAELLRELRWRADNAAGNQFVYALYDTRGSRIAGSLNVPMPGEEGLGDVSVRREGGKARSIRMGVIDTAGETRLAVAMHAEPENQIQDTILKYFIAAVTFLIFVSAVSGWVLARHLRKRLHPISATADAIVTGDLDLRVPITGRGDEFDAVGRAFNLMLDRVAALMENIRQVSSAIAHDLRKPLIRLLNEADRLGQAEGAEDRVLAIGDEMLALFSGILRIAEVEGGNLERSFENIDLSALLSDVSESFEPALVDAGHSIEWLIEPGLEVLGNKELLAQLAANLLDNARIHTPEGTAIRLGLVADGGWARLTVEDDGPGVSEADREKLLQRFFRADTSRKTPGNGLGLSLVAAAAKAHGGSVTIEHADPGLRICVALPRVREQSELDEPLPERKKGLLGFVRHFFSDRSGSVPSRDRPLLRERS